MKRKFQCLNSFDIKMIALVTMFIDHIGAVLIPENMDVVYIVMRAIGRISFPLFCYMLVEGSIHTRNIRKYEFRMLIFAFLSEIPFDLALTGDWYPEHQNVFFTLTIGLVMLDLMQNGFPDIRKKGREKTGECRNGAALDLPMQLAVLVVCMIAAYLLKTDYEAPGILFIFIFWYFRNKLWAAIPLIGLISIICYWNIQAFCLFAFLPIFMYNGEKGVSAKRLFYAAYPVHLMILAVIAMAVDGTLVFG